MNAVNKGISDLLTGDSAYMALSVNGLFHINAPEGTKYPFSRFSKAGGSTLYTFTKLVEDDLAYVLEAFAKDTDTKGGSEIAGSIVERGSAVLTDGPLVVAGRTVMCCRREQELPDGGDELDPSDNERVYNRSVLFRIEVTD